MLLESSKLAKGGITPVTAVTATVTSLARLAVGGALVSGTPAEETVVVLEFTGVVIAVVIVIAVIIVVVRVLGGVIFVLVVPVQHAFPLLEVVCYVIDPVLPRYESVRTETTTSGEGRL
jgi:hypothetical protein